MDNDQQVTLRIDSTPMFHIPGMMRYIEHMYKTHKKEAIVLANNMFNGAVKEAALHDIISGNRQPLFLPDDLDTDSLTYVFELSELNADVLDHIKNLSS